MATGVGKKTLRAGLLSKAWTSFRMILVGTEAEWILAGARKGDLWKWSGVKARFKLAGAGIAGAGLLALCAFPSSSGALWLSAALRDTACSTLLSCKPLSLSLVQIGTLSPLEWRSAAQLQNKSGSTAIGRLLNEAGESAQRGRSIMLMDSSTLAAALGSLDGGGRVLDTAAREKLRLMRTKLAFYKLMQAGESPADAERKAEAEAIQRGVEDAAKASIPESIQMLQSAETSILPTQSLRFAISGSLGRHSQLTSQTWLSHYGSGWALGVMGLLIPLSFLLALAGTSLCAFIAGIIRHSDGLDRLWRTRQENHRRMAQWKADLRDKRRAQAQGKMKNHVKR